MRTSDESDFAHPQQQNSAGYGRTLEDYPRLRGSGLRIPLRVADDVLWDEPGDSAQRVQAARERRLRQIIRRYENQIRYGCYNRSCTAPSCLSYRKRNSKTPLRPYTDTSARALACHLVEECGRSRKDPVAGLCPNQPIVPWYQDHRTTQTRRKPDLRDQHQTGGPDSSNGREASPTESRPRTSSKEGGGSRYSATSYKRKSSVSGSASLSLADTAQMQTEPLLPVTSKTQSVPANNLRRRRTRTTTTAHSQRSPRTRETIHAHHFVGHRVKYLVMWTEGNTSKAAWCTYSAIQNKAAVSEYTRKHELDSALDPAQLETLEAQLEMMDLELLPDQEDGFGAVVNERTVGSSPVKKLDFASFSQMLWNTFSLRKVVTRKANAHNVLPVAPPEVRAPPQLDATESSEDSSSENAEDLAESQSRRHAQVLHNTAFLGITLRRLSVDSVLWLGNMHDASHGEQRNTPFERFLRQSIRYSMGNPNRLLESAKSWHYLNLEEATGSMATSPDIDRYAIGDELDNGGANEAAHLQQLPDPVYVDHFSPNSTIEGFETIIKVCLGTDLLYKTFYDTIQQCYNVSHPRYSGEKMAIAARKTIKALGGGFVDHTGQDSDQQWILRKTGHILDQRQTAQVFALIIMALVTPWFDREWYTWGLDPMLLFSIMGARNENKASMNILYSSDRTKRDKRLLRCCIEVFDHQQSWHRRRLVTALTDCMSHHIAAREISQHKSSFRHRPRNVVNDAINLIANEMEIGKRQGASYFKLQATTGLGVLDIAQSVISTEWDRKAIIDRTGSVGGALELMSALYHRINAFELNESWCAMQLVAQAFDDFEMPVQWLSFEPTGRQTHILAYPFLFEIATLVKYFRAINATAMKKAFENAAMAYGDANHFFHNYHIPIYNSEDVLTTMRPYMMKYFVLTIRRDNLLEDALGQIWRRQRREILRPLRVRLGRDEGEDGLDHGGVQQEFFRLAFAEAFDPKYGMFTVDDRTHMVWFQPGSLEPLWKYEALGILLSLAIYNAVTLPITMPLAFYRKILGFKVKNLDHIKDGWPALEHGLRQLLEYDGDVAEDIGRTYEFTYEFGGAVHTIDMSGRKDKWKSTAKGKERARSPSFSLPQPIMLPLISPKALFTTPNTLSPTSDAVETDPAVGSPLSTPTSSPSIAPMSPSNSAEAPLVTNATRKAYIRDYVTHLTDTTIAPQFSAFLKGLHVCVSPRAFSLFTPTQLRELIEGHKSVNIDELQASASYEEYEAEDEYIKAFWDIVRDESRQDESFAKGLLEFVTASERVPIGGLRQGGFVVQRNGDVSFRPGTYLQEQGFSPDGTPLADGYNLPEADRAKGDRDDEGGWKVRLPSSSTCYGRLLLPRYRLILPDDVMETYDLDDTDPRELWKEVLRERLCKAVREGRGFGML